MTKSENKKPVKRRKTMTSRLQWGRYVFDPELGCKRLMRPVGSPGNLTKIGELPCPKITKKSVPRTSTSPLQRKGPKPQEYIIKNNIPWHPNADWMKVFKKASAHFKVPVEDCQLLYDTYLTWIRESMSNLELPKLIMPHICSFSVNLAAVRKYCLKLEKQIDLYDKRYGVSDDWMKKRVDWIYVTMRYQDTYFRMQEERAVRSEKYSKGQLAYRKKMYDEGKLNPLYWNEEGKWIGGEKGMYATLMEVNMARIREANKYIVRESDYTDDDD